MKHKDKAVIMQSRRSLAGPLSSIISPVDGKRARWGSETQLVS
jgi:hypothetical protein